MMSRIRASLIAMRLRSGRATRAQLESVARMFDRLARGESPQSIFGEERRGRKRTAPREWGVLLVFEEVYKALPASDKRRFSKAKALTARHFRMALKTFNNRYSTYLRGMMD